MDLDQAVRSLFKGSAVVIVGTVFEMGFSFIGKILIARHLGRTNFGAVTIGVTFLTLIGGLSVLGLDTGVARYLPQYDDPEKRWNVVVTSCLLALPVPLAFSVVGVLRPALIASALGAPDSVEVIRLFALGIPVFALTDVGIGVTRGQQRSIPYVVVQNFAKPTIRLAGLAVGVAVGASVLGMSIAYLLPQFVAFVIVAFVLWRSFDRISVSFDIGLAETLLKFSIPLALSSVFSTILSDIDTLLLSYFTETGVVGDYGVIYPLAQLVSVSLTAAGFIMMPVLSELQAEEQYGELKRTYQVGTKWVFMLSLPPFLVFTLFPTMSIASTFGWEYIQGSTGLQILALATFSSALFGLNANALSSIGHTKYISIVQASAAVINVVLNIVLIPMYGIAGAAAATLASTVLVNVLNSWRLYSVLGVYPFTPAMFRPALIAVPLIFGIEAVARQFLEITPRIGIALTFVFLLSYATAILAFGGIEEEEVMIVNSVEERFDVSLEPIKRWIRLFM